MELAVTKQLLVKFFEGKCTSFEEKAIERWLCLAENNELFYRWLNEWELENPQVAIDENFALKLVLKKIEFSKKNNELFVEKIALKKLNGWLIAKVAIIIIILNGGIIYFTKTQNKPSSQSFYEKNVDKVKLDLGKIFEKENKGIKPMLLNLPDGSSVLLKPKAKISYNPKVFGVQSREVILSGEAFFEVFKDAKRPFVVYANDLIAKVLGTSFTINASDETKKTEVIVKSGFVSVFHQGEKQISTKTETGNLQGIILTKNQKIIIDEKEAFSVRKIMESYSEEEEGTQNFNFDESRVIDIFNLLESFYNIDIVYDKNKFSNTTLTAHLGDEPLSEKLKLICLALEVTYREVDGKIIILSNE